MDNRPSWSPKSTCQEQRRPDKQCNMSMMAVATPSPRSIFREYSLWGDAARPAPDYTRPRTENRTMALPSIRQTFPDLHLDGSSADKTAHGTSPFAHRSPGAVGQGLLASPEYVHSPHVSKRRRISNEDEAYSPHFGQPPRPHQSPERFSPLGGEQTTTETWASSSRAPRHEPSSRIPLPVEVRGRVGLGLPTLPRLPPSMQFDTREPATMPPQHGRDTGRCNEAAPAPDRAAAYPTHDYGYSYQRPSRYQSLSAGSMRPQDGAPHSASGSCDSHYEGGLGRYGDVGGGTCMGVVDVKQRKRRGNLPKETTDKLRGWFMGHLQHPYPTEDEKQELMRQTGLQMNQISNWFINARRRQLPAMMNSARAESDASSGESKIVATTEGSVDYAAAAGRRGEAMPLSDGEGGAYDVDMSSLRKRRGGHLNRESV